MADVGVRPARPDDATALGALQAAAFRAAYAAILPATQIDSAAFAATWLVAITTPPTARHAVLVALAGPQVVGLAALGPAEGHPDLDPGATAEVYALLVDPAARGVGHGSRLQQAAVDKALELGFTAAVAWVAEPDERLRAFLVSSGWAPDGARRVLDLRGDGAVLVAQERLRTGFGPP